MAGMTLNEIVHAQFPDISEAEHYLLECIAAGNAFDCVAFLESDLAPTDFKARNAMRIIRAELISWICKDKQCGIHITRNGIRINGATIHGILDISGADLSKPIAFTDCSIEGGLDCEDTQFESLDISASKLPFLSADRINLTGNLTLRNASIQKGELRLHGASIGGDFDCSGAQISPDKDNSQSEEGEALSASRINVAGNVILREGFVANGSLQFSDASIGGNFDCSGAQILHVNKNIPSAHSPALAADRIKVEGDLLLRGGFTAKGGVRLQNAIISGGISCAGGQFLNEGGDALFAEGIMVVNGVYLRGAFIAKGTVSFSGAVISADFNCDNGQFLNENGTALALDHMKVTGNLTLRNGFQANGAVLLNDTTIGGGFSCDAGIFSNVAQASPPVSSRNAAGEDACATRNGIALFADRLKVKGHVSLRGGFEANGAVRLNDASIGGHFSCAGGQIENVTGTFQNADGDALSADRLIVGGNVMLRSGFEAKGTVRLNDASIGGYFDCEGGLFRGVAQASPPASSRNTAGEDACATGNGDALLADNLKVSGNLNLSGGFTANGSVCLRNALISGDFNCTDGHFEKRNGEALSAEGIMVVGAALLRGKFTANGTVCLRNAEIGGNLACDGGTFGSSRAQAPVANNLSQDKHVIVLDAHRAKVGGCAIFLGGCAIYGTINLSEARIEMDFQWSEVKDVTSCSLDLRGAKVGALVTGKGSLPLKENCQLEDFVHTVVVFGIPQSAFHQPGIPEIPLSQQQEPPELQKSGGFTASISQMFKRKD